MTTKTLCIEDWKDTAQASVKLSDDREVELRRPILRSGIWAAQRPGWGKAAAAVDVIVSRASKGALDSAEVRALSGPNRRRLIVALVRLKGVEKDWRNLYGTSLTLDERFVATLVWAERREAQALQGQLIDIRKRLLENPQSQIQQMARDVTGRGALAKQMAGINSQVRAGILGPTPHFPLASAAGMLRSMDFITGFDKGLGVSPMAEIAKAATASWGTLGVRSVGLDTSAVEKVLASGIARASFQANLTEISAQMRPLSLQAIQGFDTTKFIQDLSAVKALSIQGFAANADFLKGGLGLKLPSALLSGLDSLKFGLGSDLWHRTHGMVESVLMEELARLWRGDPLWHLVSSLNPRRLPALIERRREEVYEAVLDGLEEVVRNSDLTEQLLVACKEMGFLSSEQRDWLRHGLGHAQEGDWLQAMPPMTWGFEGAIFNGAVAAEVIAVRKGKKLAAEKVIKAIKLDEELEVFATRLVFGGPGNAFRHGRPENEARDQALLQIVALVGWIDFTLGTSGTARLARRLESSLLNVLGSSQHPELVAA